MQKIARTLFTAAFVLSGIAHFAYPKLFIALMPREVPNRKFWVDSSGVLELLLAAGLWLKPVRTLAGWGTFLLMVLFTPIHIYDLLREKPVVGSKTAAIVRLVMQGVLLRLSHSLTHEDSPVEAGHERE